MYTQITKNEGIAATIIGEGRIAAFPTGTSYGLAADALQGFALQRLRQLKNRPTAKTFTIMLTVSLWDKYLLLTNDERKLLNQYKDQPLTLLVKPKPSLEHLAKNGFVGLRVIDHPLMKALAEAARVPLTATSANQADQKPCHSVDCIVKTFPGRIDETTYDLSLGCILDGGTLSENPSTTIAKLEKDKIKIVRQGALIFPL
ncbi:MAG: L-threonylcarbamoyladenylate synthase [Candidatus Andersenbacteria bacterium]|nr:L-threonylcarbamoyladenylate synthase [bacterium]MDZ4225320.1 L-threonylcarbamoyladenylate synthase [Candidatus Andersenbacteria bacterium]